jgi:hypothetical protein
VRVRIGRGNAVAGGGEGVHGRGAGNGACVIGRMGPQRSAKVRRKADTGSGIAIAPGAPKSGSGAVVVAPPAGIEPATCRLGGGRSIH